VKSMPVCVAFVGGLAVWLLTASVSAQPFTFQPPGTLQSGDQGRVDETVFMPDMRYPVELAPSYPNSQVYGHGGSQGPGGGQCDAANFSYPWWDNYCEPRSWDMPLCPSGTGHQGQDIRAASCADKTYWAVAAESGTITNIGSYSVNLLTDGGTQHRYLHMDAASIQVRAGQRVNKGDRMGKISNNFGGTPTTIHLHYDVTQSVQGVGTVYVPPYMSLVRAYERLIGAEAQPCALVGPDGGVLDNSGPCFALYGPSQYWRHVTDAGTEGDLYWTHAFVSANPSNWARWNLVLEQAGAYRVSAFIVDAYAGSVEAPYELRHAGSQDRVIRDISTADGWVDLGTWDFSEGGDQWVSLYDNTSEGSDLQHRLMADAIRLERVRPPEPDAGPPDVDSPMDTGSPEPDAAVEDTGTVEPDVPLANNGQPTNNGEPTNNGAGNNGGRPTNNDVKPGNNGTSGGNGEDDGTPPQTITVQSKGACAAAGPGASETGWPVGLALLAIGLVWGAATRR